MAEGPKSNLLRPDGKFPPASLPTVFADGLLNVSNSHSEVRFYLMRADPALNGDAEFKAQPIAQIVMPLQSFMHTTIFFEHQLDVMIAQGLIDVAAVDEARAQAAVGQQSETMKAE